MMRAWEQKNSYRIHKRKLSSIKPTMSTQYAARGVLKPIKEVALFRQLSSKASAMNSIPLFRLLKIQNLQQYAKELTTRGYGYNLERLSA